MLLVVVEGGVGVVVVVVVVVVFIDEVSIHERIAYQCIVLFIVIPRLVSYFSSFIIYYE